MGAERKHDLSLKYTVSAIMDIPDQGLREKYLYKAYELDCNNAAYELGMIEKSKSGGERLSEKAVEFFTKGTEIGDIDCAFALIGNYSPVIGNGNFNNKKDISESIKWFEFLFAYLDKNNIKNIWAKSDLCSYYFLFNRNLLSGSITAEYSLCSYYYAYAITLNYFNENDLKDRELSNIYFKKSLDASPDCLNKIVNFAVEEYLFPENSSSGFQSDVFYAEELLELAEKYFYAYYKYILKNEASEASQLWNNLTKNFRRGYNKISECYKLGESVQKDDEKAKMYTLKAEEIVKRMNAIALANPIPADLP